MINRKTEFELGLNEIMRKYIWETHEYKFLFTAFVGHQNIRKTNLNLETIYITDETHSMQLMRGLWSLRYNSMISVVFSFFCLLFCLRRDTMCLYGKHIIQSYRINITSSL